MSTNWSDTVMSRLDGVTDDKERLRLAARMTDEAVAHLDRVRVERDQAANRLRRDGVAMVDIAMWARVSDSYLTRRLLKRGAKRRVARRLR